MAVPSSIRITVACTPEIPRSSSMIATSDRAPLAAITVMLVNTGRTTVTGARIPMRSRSCATSRNMHAMAGGASTYTTEIHPDAASDVPPAHACPNQIVTNATAPKPAKASRCERAGTHSANAPNTPMIVPPRTAKVAAEIAASASAFGGTMTMYAIAASDRASTPTSATTSRRYGASKCAANSSRAATTNGTKITSSRMSIACGSNARSVAAPMSPKSIAMAPTTTSAVPSARCPGQARDRAAATTVMPARTNDAPAVSARATEDDVVPGSANNRATRQTTASAMSTGIMRRGDGTASMGPPIMAAGASRLHHPWAGTASAGRTRPGGGYSIRRRRSASATAAVRSEAPSFSKMCSRWVFTVSGEM